MTRNLLVDPQVHQLAEHFLNDLKPDLSEAEYAQHVADLAGDIQTAVEVFFNFRDTPQPEPDGCTDGY